MSRFKPSSSSPVSRDISFHPSERYVAPVVTVPQIPVPTASAAAVSPELIESSPRDMDALGFIFLCLYMLSGSLNDWTIRLLGNKAYISTIMLLATPIVYLLSRNRFRALRHPMGRWWAAFLVMLLLATPFSVWRGGSTALLLNYVPRSYILFFFITAFVTSVQRCYKLLMILILCSAIMLLSCFEFGNYDQDGRFRIMGSLFLSNSNDLALALLIGVTQLGFLLRVPGVFKKIFAAPLIGLSFIYLLRTGSRGCLIGSLAYGVLVFVFSRNKAIVIVLALATAAVAILANPTAPFSRFTTFDNVSTGAGASTMQRKQLFFRSLQETVLHPLFGVGPGQFAVAVAGEAEAKGEHAAALGTHNSYTQVSAECGVPALVCYTATIVFCFMLNYRMFSKARNNPSYARIASLSFTLLSGILVYSTTTLFFHMAYSGILPILAGLTLSLYFSSRSVLEIA